MRGWIGVDLDATLAKYNGWVNGGHIGEPVPAMVARVQSWLASGQEVRIFTARVYSDGTRSRDNEAEAALRVIQDWCFEHIGTILPVTCVKDFGMIALYDDRAVQVEPNTGRLIGGE